MLTEFLTVIVGAAVILLLAEVIIRKSIQLANHYGISGTFIGLTVLSIGTSIPEIMTHIIGSVNILKSPEQMNSLSALLIGTNIGSDVFQQNFILAVIGLLGGIVVIRKTLFIQMGGLIGAALLVWVFSLGGYITRIEGVILLLAYLAYLFYLKSSKINEEFQAENNLSRKAIVWAVFVVLIGFVIMGLVSDEVLNASTILVSQLNISASFFGIVLLGISTALPELTTSLVAVFKRKKDISAGILIGSNITNPLFGIGIGAVISEYVVPNVVVFYDLPFKIVTAFLIYYFLIRDEQLDKWEAIVLIVLFFAFLIFRQIYFPTDF